MRFFVVVVVVDKNNNKAVLLHNVGKQSECVLLVVSYKLPFFWQLQLDASFRLPGRWQDCCCY